MKKLLLLVLVAAFIVPALAAQGIVAEGRANFSTISDFTNADGEDNDPKTITSDTSGVDVRLGVTAKDDFSSIKIVLRSANVGKDFITGTNFAAGKNGATNFYIDEIIIKSDLAKLFGIKDFVLNVTGGYTDIKGQNYSKVDDLEISRIYDRIGSGKNKLMFNAQTSKVILARQDESPVLALDVGIKEATLRVGVEPGILTGGADTQNPFVAGIFGQVDALKYEVFLANKFIDKTSLTAGLNYNLAFDKSAALLLGAGVFVDLSNAATTATVGPDNKSVQTTATFGWAAGAKFSLKGDFALDFGVGLKGYDATGAGLSNIGATLAVTPFDIITLKANLILDTFDYKAYAGGVDQPDALFNTFTIGLEKAIGKQFVIGAGWIIRGENAGNLDGVATRDTLFAGNGLNIDGAVDKGNNAPYLAVLYKF